MAAQPLANDLVSRSSDKRQLIGRVVGTERQPNTAYQFHFWATPEAPVGIGTLVVVDAGYRKVWGIVTEGHGYNDVVSPMFDYLGADGKPDSLPPTDRPEIRVYTAAVLRHHPEQPVQPVPIAPVYSATEQDVQVALRIDEIPEHRRIPIGVYESGAGIAPIYVDADFLLGPEAGHLNVTGASGLAAKTSAIQFLLTAIFQKTTKSVAVVCFNVKGGDLLFLDLPPAHQLSERDLKIYEAVGVEPKPFPRVEYYAPYKPDRVNLATLRTHPQLRHNVHPMLWGMREVMRYVEVLLNKDDVDAKADAFLQFLRQRVIEPGEFAFEEEEADILMARGIPGVLRVNSFSDLVRWFEAVLKLLEAKNQKQWRSFAVETIRKIQNRLVNLTTRFAGLVGEGDNALDLPWGKFQDRTVYVIDVANLSAEAQDLIFTRVVAELRERMEQRTLGVDTVIVVVDELNQYAPNTQRETYVMRTLRDICARGRYLGLVLFGAQQFRSQVDRQIVGNCSTSLYGRIEMEEIAQPSYNIFGEAVKEKLGALAPGEMLVRHPYFNQPVFVRFPRPAIMRGQDGLQLYQPEADKPLEDAVWENLRRLNPNLPRTAVVDVLARAQNGNGELDRERVIAALHKTLTLHPTADKVLEVFEREIPKPVATRRVEPETLAPETALPVDPLNGNLFDDDEELEDYDPFD
ncbi:MAG: ATP-binding protein [Armatimonadota bacterium]|nr:ATP-binding protein [Armatimonadota bacterium]